MDRNESGALTGALSDDNGRSASPCPGSAASAEASVPAAGAAQRMLKPDRPDASRLVWLDMEMTGLRPEIDRIIEVAMVVTDSELNVLAEGPVLVVHQPDEVLDGMDDWNKSTHGRSGLIDRVRASRLTEAGAQKILLDFISAWVPAGKSPMCGNSIGQDRRFMARYMPELEAFFHYRNLDVSTLKELARRWAPDISRGFSKKGAHTALADIIESIEELRYYRHHFISANGLRK